MGSSIGSFNDAEYYIDYMQDDISTLESQVSELQDTVWWHGSAMWFLWFIVIIWIIVGVIMINDLNSDVKELKEQISKLTNK